MRTNMDSSFDEALMLLSKCREENIPVTVLINTGDSASVVGGFISELSSLGMSVSSLDPTTRMKHAEVHINFSMASTFKFQDVREAPAEIRESMGKTFDYVIEIALESTTQCVVIVRRS
jgi:hypothetical protein